MRDSFRLTFVFSLCVLLPLLAHAEYPQHGALSRLNIEINRMQARVRSIEQGIEILDGKAQRKEEKLQELALIRDEILTSQKRQERRKLRLEGLLKTIEHNLSSVQEAWIERLKAYYIKNILFKNNVFPMETSAGGGFPEKTRYFLTLLQRNDTLLYAQFKELKSARAKNIAMIDTIARALKQKKNDIVDSEKRLDEELMALSTLRALMTEKKRERTRTIKDLEQKATRIQETLEKIMGSEFTPEVHRARESSPLVMAGILKEPSSAGKRAYKNGLPTQFQWPLKGRIIRSFGKHRVSRFKDIIYSKGLDIFAQRTSTVRAVDNGTVQYTGIMPGFDKVVILAHGERDYTLYGRLSESNVLLGATVASGDALGTISLETASETNFYFEVRKKGKAINPLKFLVEEG